MVANFFLAVFLIFVPSAFFSILTKRRIEYFIGFMLPLWGVVVYLSGIAGYLPAGVIIIVSAISAMPAVILLKIGWTVRRRRLRELLNRVAGDVLTPGALLFILGAAFAAYLSFGRCYSFFDEYAHWGKLAKIMFDYNSLPVKDPEALKWILFRNYPPGGACLGYLFAKLFDSSVFVESSHIFAMEMLFVSLFTLFTANAKWRNFWVCISLVVALFCTCMLFNDFFYMVYVDTALGVISAAAMFYAALDRHYGWGNAMATAVELSFLVLLKASGAGLAVFVAVAPAFLGICNIVKLVRHGRYRALVAALKYFLPCLCFLILLAHKCSLHGIELLHNNSYDFPADAITLGNLLDGIRYDASGYFYVVLDRMVDNVFFLRRSQFMIPMSIFSSILVMTVLGVAAGRLCFRRLRHSTTVALAVVFFCFPVYSFTLFLYYEFSFIEPEARNTAACIRYLSTYFVFAWTTVLAVAANAYFFARNNGEKRSAAFVPLIILVPILSLPVLGEKVKGFFDPVTPANKWILQSFIMRQVIDQELSGDEKFFMIYQGDSWAYIHVCGIHYYKNLFSLNPRWGKAAGKTYDANKIAYFCRENQYCYLAASNDDLVNEFGAYFDTSPTKPNVLYRCDPAGKFFRIPLKKFTFDFQYCSLFETTAAKKARATYSARKKYLNVQMMREGRLTLSPISQCPLWNGSAKRLVMRIDRLKGDAALVVTINDTPMWEGRLSELNGVLSVELPCVEVDNLTLQFRAADENCGFAITQVELEYAESQP